jgi:two-component system NtrC family sensor kinase
VRLFIKLHIAGFFVMTAILALFAWIQVRRESELFYSDTLADNKAVAARLSSAVELIWAERGRSAAEAFLLEADARSSGPRVRFLAEGAAELPPDSPPGLVNVGSLGEQAVVVRAPINVRGASVGSIELTESMAARDEFVRRTVVQEVTLATVLLVAGAAFNAFLGYRMVGRRVNRMVAQARRVGSGDFSSKLGDSGRDELSALSREIDLMCDQLEASQRRAREATEARIAAMEQLRHAERLAMVGTLASGIAHELGTPLNVITMRARMIERGEETGLDARNSARIVAEQGARMTRIVRDLLEFARPRPPERANIELRHLVERTVRLLEPVLKRYVVTARISDASQDVIASVDPAQVEQVLTNLVMNAAQAPRPAGAAGTVAVRVAVVRQAPPAGGDPAPFACISVEDDGAGISPELLARIFEPFVTSKPAGEGTGLGLTVSAGFVSEHGGWIHAKSEQGKGSVFSVYLPIGATEGAST